MAGSVGALASVTSWLVFLAVIGRAPISANEYCWEKFNATCADDEVVLMSTALYGRMKLGRCLTRNYYVGCQSDVMPFMDKLCSGRHSCELDIPDTDLQSKTGCPNDLVAYLNATFECVKVAFPKDGAAVASAASSCDKSRRNNFVNTTETGYVSSLVSVETNMGMAPCPWVITVPKGQKINVTLLDFSVNQPLTSADDMCTMYASLREGSRTSMDIMVCGGESRNKVIYLSDSNSVVIEINGALGQNRDKLPYFLLKYDPVGCPDLEAPSGGWVDRHQHKIAMGCNNTLEVRHLVCSGNTWVGEPSNCSGAHMTSSHDAHGSSSRDVPFGLVLAIVIGVILGIVIGSLLLGAVLYSQNKCKRNEPSQNIGGVTDQEKTQILQSGTYGYAHVWELQQLRGNPDYNPVDTQQRRICTNTEFGSHLGKPPICLGQRDHSYESPRFSGCNTGRRLPDIHTGYPHPGFPQHPNCHELDVHIRTTVGNASTGSTNIPHDNPDDARYSE